jgi:polyamine oxidase
VGYSQLITFLGTGLEDVRLNSVVSRIAITATGGVEVTTSQGVFDGDAVVVTVPLGVLKAGTIVFEPQLSAAKLDAIARMGMGNFNKVFLQFPTRFWPAAGPWYLGIQDAAPYGVLISTMETIQPGSNILIVWFDGDSAIALEQMTDEGAVDAAMSNVHTCFDVPSASSTIPAPTAFFVTRWKSEPFTRGSYSYPKVNTTYDDVDTLRANIQKKVFFAGEGAPAYGYTVVLCAGVVRGCCASVVVTFSWL